MKNAFLFPIVFLGLAVTACQNPNFESANNTLDLPDSLSSRRLAFVIDLKKQVAENHWEEFGVKATEGTFIYFNGDESEVFFPSPKVLDKLDEYVTFSDDYVLSPRTDSIPFHFELMISFNSADSTKFYYDHPVQQFLSVEETGIFIPSVESTEMWTTMVIHEMFHHFQYNTPSFQEYAKNEIGPLPFDSRDLNRLCREDNNFLKLIRIENQILLDALSAPDTDTRISLIKEYLQARTQRMESYGKEYPFLEKIENYYVTQEGAARYLEYQSMQVLNDFANQDNPPVIKDDPRFKSFQEFAEIDLTDDEFSYLEYADATSYYYALGFSTMRLLDLLEVDYKGKLLNTPEKALFSYLEEYVSLREK